MNRKKLLLVVSAVAGVSLAGIGGWGVASAATNTSSNGIADKLATKFNLHKDDVAAVFEEEKTDRQQKVEERLTQAVAEGKITADQKAKILAKLAEVKAQMESNREAWRHKTPQERHQARKEQREALRKWAKDNNIPLQYLRMAGIGHHAGMRLPPTGVQ